MENSEDHFDVEKYITISLQLLSAHSDFLFYFINAGHSYPVRHCIESLSYHLLSLKEFEKFLYQKCRT
jgi:hypothetical protein